MSVFPTLPCAAGPCLSNRLGLGLGLTERFSHPDSLTPPRHRTLSSVHSTPYFVTLFFPFLPESTKEGTTGEEESTCSWYSTLLYSTLTLLYDYSNTLPLLIRRASLFELLFVLLLSASWPCLLLHQQALSQPTHLLNSVQLLSTV